MASTSKLRSNANPKNSLPGYVIYASGAYKYQLDWSWGNLPKEIKCYGICGVACDSKDFVYALTRCERYPIIVLNPEGKIVDVIGQNLKIGRMHGIYITREDTIWITDDITHLAMHFDLSGNLLQTIGKYGVASDSGYDESVSFPESLKTIKGAAPPFNRPTKIVQAPNNDLYASDGYRNVAIHHFDSNGYLLKTWGCVGNDPGCFALPHSLVADIWGRIWTCDRENDRVQVFDADGNLLKIFNELLYPIDLCTDGESIFVAEHDGRISIYNLRFDLISQIGYSGSPLRAHGLCCNSIGDLFLAILQGETHLIKMEKS